MFSEPANAARAVGAVRLDHLAEATVVIDRTGFVRQANEAAWKLLQDGSGVMVQEGILTTRQPQVRAMLRRLIALAARGIDAVCTIRGRDGAPPVQVLFLALPDRRVMAHLRAAAYRDGPPETAMRTRFAMTAAEAELTVRLAEGGTLAEAAERMRLSPGPAHDLLRRVLCKTGHSTADSLGALLDTNL